LLLTQAPTSCLQLLSRSCQQMLLTQLSAS